MVDRSLSNTPEGQVEEKKSTTVLLTEAERPSGITDVIDVNVHSSLQICPSDSLGKAVCQQLEGECDSRDQVYWKVGSR